MACGRLPVRVRNSPHDACIARLPGGVTDACCGHAGLPRRDERHQRSFDCTYVAFDDGLVLRGNPARAAMEILGGDPPPCDLPPTGVPGISWADPPR